MPPPDFEARSLFRSLQRLEQLRSALEERRRTLLSSGKLAANQGLLQDGADEESLIERIARLEERYDATLDKLFWEHPGYAEGQFPSLVEAYVEQGWPASSPPSLSPTTSAVWWLFEQGGILKRPRTLELLSDQDRGRIGDAVLRNHELSESEFAAALDRLAEWADRAVWDWTLLQGLLADELAFERIDDDGAPVLRIHQRRGVVEIARVEGEETPA